VTYTDLYSSISSSISIGIFTFKTWFNSLDFLQRSGICVNTITSYVTSGQKHRLLCPDWLQHHLRMEKIKQVHSFSNAWIELESCWIELESCRIESNRNCVRVLKSNRAWIAIVTDALLDALVKPICHNNARQLSFACRRNDAWNDLPVNVVNALSLSSFKKLLKSCCLD